MARCGTISRDMPALDSRPAAVADNRPFFARSAAGTDDIRIRQPALARTATPDRTG
jgi:hypothetical protein